MDGEQREMNHCHSRLSMLETLALSGQGNKSLAKINPYYIEGLYVRLRL